MTRGKKKKKKLQQRNQKPEMCVLWEQLLTVVPLA